MIDADDGVVAAMASWIKWPTSWAVARDTAAECAQGLRVMWRELADFGCREGTDVQAWQQQRANAAAVSTAAAVVASAVAAFTALTKAKATTVTRLSWLWLQMWM